MDLQLCGLPEERGCTFGGHFELQIAGSQAVAVQQSLFDISFGITTHNPAQCSALSERQFAVARYHRVVASMRLPGRGVGDRAAQRTLQGLRVTGAAPETHRVMRSRTTSMVEERRGIRLGNEV